MKKIQDVSLNFVQTKPLEQIRPIVEINKDDETMLAAIILFENGNKCHIVTGLLNGLAEKKKYQEEANFYLGVCAHKMGFNSEAVSRLLNVVKLNNKEFTKEAITNLVEDLPSEYDSQVAPVLRNINLDMVEDKAKDNYYYVLARAAHERAQYEDMIRYAAKVSEKSSNYKNAKFIFSIGQYGTKKPKEAEAGLVSLRQWLQKKGISDRNLEALIAVNLARIAFTQKRYEAANQEYLKVPKDHPLWVQALIEQGWTQLNIDDPEGAIGNMYSLHSPYFKYVYMPESWVVRTIGYINICQYGDAYRTLTRHEQIHSDWLAYIDRYTKVKRSPADYYNTVRNYIKGQSDKGVDGLPPQVIREIARQKGFLNAQGAINNLEDEISQYSFVYNIVRKDKSEMAAKLSHTRARLNKINSDLAKAQKQSELIKYVNEWKAQKRLDEQLVWYYGDMLKLYEEARKGYQSMRGKAVARIEIQKAGLRGQAGRELMSHLKDARSNIRQMLEGNEFLRYEIFAGSGENIRYQVAGGATENTKRIPSNIKPQKIMNWEFDGEYWEDEIGSYRSSLKNNCPKSPRAHSARTEDGSGIN